MSNRRPIKALRVEDFSPYRIAEFWSNFLLSPSGCMIFAGSSRTNRQGYGVVEMRGRTARSHKRALAHRAAYAMTWGDCPADKMVLHTCDTPACINPAHLFLGTQADNVADMIVKKRSRFYGHSTGGAIATKV